MKCALDRHCWLKAVKSLSNVAVALAFQAATAVTFCSKPLNRSKEHLPAWSPQHGRNAEAAPLCVRVLKGRQSSLGASHPKTLQAVDALAQLHAGQGEYEEAEPLYKRALKMRQQVRKCMCVGEKMTCAPCVSHSAREYRSRSRMKLSCCYIGRTGYDRQWGEQVERGNGENGVREALGRTG
eukprot:365307-Chlamydomonas_euryale.AAC.2